MKQNLFGLLAVILAISLTAFTSVTKYNAQSADESVLTTKYYEYKSGAQSDPANYDKRTTPVLSCAGNSVLCTIVVTDQDSDTDVDDDDFIILFDALDTDDDQTLNDQTETSTLQKKS